MTPTLENIQLEKGAHDSPVLATFLREWYDAVEDDFRQKLKPLIPRVVGTAGDGKDEVRRWMATDWLVRVHAPAWLDSAGLTRHATALRAADVVHDSTSAEKVQPALAAALDAAWDAAGDAAWDAALAAANSAACDAAADAAAGVASGSAARNNAGAAAWDAARSAARSAAGIALQPTVESLQASALDLLDRMIIGVAA